MNAIGVLLDPPKPPSVSFDSAVDADDDDVCPCALFALVVAVLDT